MLRRREHRTRRVDLWVLALVAWLPAFASSPGDVAADTKQFLYLDPGWLLGRTTSLWDESAGLGTVTHQNIGYLWPMGPWFWLSDLIGLPMWVSQRLWFGLIVFVAGTGVRQLLRRLGLTASGPVLVGALAYALSPYQLAYTGRTSVLLLPWAGLPWLIVLAIDAGRRGTWRAPALFSLAVVTIGAVNASALVFVGIGPLLWFPVAVWVSRELPWRRALSAVARIGVCSLPVNLWWMAGLRTQAAYGLPILQLTESLETVAETTSAAELMRGLGYWYFYGRDGAAVWTDAVRWYTQSPVLIIVSFTVPALAMAGSVLVRWRYRAFFLLLVLVGLVLSVGTHPYDDPAPVGGLVKSASLSGSAAFALRNSPRAVPLLALGLACSLSAGLVAVGPWLSRLRPSWPRRRVTLLPVLATAVVVVAAFPPAWTGRIVQPQLRRDEALPDHWTAVTAELDRGEDATRVLEVPGQDFGAYRWGYTQDLLTRGLMDRDWAGRELIPFGSPASADLLRALDHRLQEGTFDPASVGPVAHLVSAGTVLLRTDAQYERFRTPRPRLLWDWFGHGDLDGLTFERGWGEPTPNVAIDSQPLRDEVELSTPAGAPFPPPVATYSVDDAVPMVHAASAERPLLLAGDGEGIVDAAEAGLLTDGQLVRYAASLSPEELDQAVAGGADLVLTDTNRRRAQRWGTLRENFGYTELAGEAQLVRDPKDTRLEVFPGATDDSYSVTELEGDGRIVSARATAYGNPVSYTPEDRPLNAVDGDLGTAWKVGAFDEVRGERLVIELAGPTQLDHITVWQPQGMVDNRWITAITVRFSDGSGERFTLDDSSRAPSGQELRFDPRSTDRVQLEIDDANLRRRPAYPGISPVGLAEVSVDGATAAQVVRPPVDLLSVPSAAGVDQRLAVVLSRLRADATEPFRGDPERAIVRSVELPADRDYAVVGTLRLSARASEEVLDGLLLDGTGSAAVRSSGRISGQPAARGSAALDGSTATAWVTPFGEQRGRWLTATAAEPTTIDHLDLALVADGRHSVVTRVRLIADGGTPIEVDVPAVTDGTAELHTASVRIELPPTTFSELRVEVAEVRPVRTIDFYSSTLVDMPIGIAELGLGSLSVGAPRSVVELCAPVTGLGGLGELCGTTTPAAAESGDPVVALAEITLPAATHRIEATLGALTGVDADRIVLVSERGGDAAVVDEAGHWSSPEPTPAPAVELVADGLHSASVEITGATEPFWLVFGQSESAGWRAVADGTDLGRSGLVDGYANGWLIDPDGRATIRVDIEWTPQRVVDIALWVSAAAVVGIAAVALIDPGRRRGISTDAPAVAEPRAVGRWTGPLPWRTTAALTVGAAGAGWFLAGPWGGLGLAGAALVSSRSALGRWSVALAPWLVFAPVGSAVMILQVGHEHRPGVEWPNAFPRVHEIVLVCVLVAGVDAVVERCRRSRVTIPFRPPG